MANKSAAAEAIKDMLAEGIDASLLKSIIRTLHKLNKEAGITSIGEDARIRVKAEVEVKITIQPSPHAFWDKQPAPSRRFRYNPDGSIALFNDGWDND